MADEPKPAPAGAPKPPAGAPAAPPAKDPFVEIVSVIGGILIFLYIVNRIIGGLGSTSIFSHGFKGLTPDGIVYYHTRPIASLDNPIGAKIVTLHDISVYGDAGGYRIGDQPFNKKGVILQGPDTVENISYYKVDFESGTDGWVQDGGIGYITGEPSVLERLVLWLFAIFSILRIISFLVSFCIFIGLIYIVRHLTAIRANEHKLLYPEASTPLAPMVNQKWERILAHSESQNENDWRLAILEADILLNDLLEKLSLPGDTMGDKLKAVDPNDFKTIDNAWEAHKIRNQIAHEGVDFQLSERETRRVIDLYKNIFSEFQTI